MIDTVDLAFLEVLGDGGLQLLCRLEIGTKRLFNHHTAPVLVFLGQAYASQLLDNGGKIGRTYGEEISQVLRENGLVGEGFFQAVKGLSIIRWIGMILVTRNKALEHFLVIAILELGIQHTLDISQPVLAGNWAATDGQNCHLLGQAASLVQTEQTGHQLDAGKIAAGTKQYQGTRIYDFHSVFSK